MGRDSLPHHVRLVDPWNEVPDTNRPMKLSMTQYALSDHEELGVIDETRF
jgi:hypothetical protein